MIIYKWSHLKVGFGGFWIILWWKFKDKYYNYQFSMAIDQNLHSYTDENLPKILNISIPKGF
jgi:hypothetical protein